MMGYLRAFSPGVIDPPPNGWHDTGDIVKIDDEGFMTILGRAKRFAKIGGEMISLAAVEEVINECWPEEKHAVVMLPDGSKGEALALITTMHGIKRDELRRRLAELGMAEIAIPKKVVTMDDMPLLATGKIDYVALEETLGAHLNDS